MFGKTLLIMSLLFIMPAVAEELQVPTQNRAELSIAIYNENLALVKDVRRVALAAGVNDIAFLDVSAQIRPETALVKGNGFFVKEQNFNFDLLTYGSMIEKSLGEKVRLEYINPGNGEIKVEYGEIISNANGSVVLKIGDRIETSYPGRIIFLNIPKSLRAKPTLVLNLDVQAAGERPVGLSYLTGGLAWKVDYVAELNDAETEMNVNGLVTLTNMSGVSYSNATMQLVAGNVNQVQQVMVKGLRMASMMESMPASMDMAYSCGAGVARETFMDFHLYTMPGKVNIEDRQTKQVSLLAGKVKTEKEYIYKDMFDFYNNNTNAGEFKKKNPTVELKFKNDGSSQGLEVPLPAGIFRVYKSDSKGNPLFAGEDKIGHTPKNDEVRIKLGTAFDVSASGKRISYTSLGSRSFEAEYEIAINNAKDDDVEIKLYQQLPNNVEIIGEAVKGTKENSNEYMWRLKVPKNGAYTFRFKARVIFN